VFNFIRLHSLLMMITGFTGLALAAPVPQPLPFNGGCPFGYTVSSNYCVPGSGARYAIERRGGGCPFGYNVSGNYCLATSNDTRTSIHRNGGGCPFGYTVSGDYCVSSQ